MSTTMGMTNIRLLGLHDHCIWVLDVLWCSARELEMKGLPVVFQR